jgi:hypothetical protein
MEEAMKKHSLLVAGAIVLLANVSAVLAQPHLKVPQASPRAAVEETMGITDIAVSYHRPSVNGRRIWGGLVPYDVPWRTGANENTTVSFSTPVTIEGQPLAAGSYSLFMIPGQPQWTVVFNKFTGGWGTYSYDPAEDVLRVKVTPQAAEMNERLAFTFDDAKPASVNLSMRWEKLRVPVKIEAETVKLTLANIRNQLRSANHWQAAAWSEAAGYAMRNGQLDTALEYADHSISLGADVQNLSRKAAILQKKGDAAGAKALRDQAATLSPENASLGKAYELIGGKKLDDAVTYLNDYIAKQPTSFRAWSTLGVVYSQKGDKAKSSEAFAKATSLAADQSERVEVQDDINAIEAEVK